MAATESVVRRTAVRNEPVPYTETAPVALSRATERRTRARWFLALAMGTAAVAAVEVTVRLRITELGYRIEATARALTEVELENQELQARREQLEDPVFLEQWAQQRLGLRRPKPEERIVLR